jgi:hypothetical protein
MAKFYGTEGTKYNDGVTSKNLAKRADGSRTNMRLHSMVETFTIPATFATNDEIVLPPLPKGAIQVPSLCAIHANKKPAATSIAFVVGDAADDDKFSAAVTVNAAGTFAFTTATDQSIALAEADGATPILLKGTVTGAVDTTAVLTIRIGYLLRS